MSQTFPSPYGDYGSYQRMNKKSKKKLNSLVSVPLRGLWFLSSCTGRNFIRRPRPFPSPYGDYGSYQLMFPMQVWVETLSFRPLTGIMVLIRGFLPVNTRNGICFRPLTGIMVLISMGSQGLVSAWWLFPSPYGDYGSYRYVKTLQRFTVQAVSVPLRGLWFLSILNRAMTTNGNGFPSPYGDYGSYAGYLPTDETSRNVSVPLRGLWFLSP